MNFNRIIPLLFATAILAGCGSGGYGAADQAEAPSTEISGTSTGSAATSATAPAKLASHTQDPNMRQAVNKRAVIRNGSLTVRVPNVEDAERKVTKFVNDQGGYVSASESSDLASQAPSITISLRIPIGSFDQGMMMFEGLGTRLAKKISGEDVTAKVVDFDARMKIMSAQETSLRNSLERSSYSSDTVQLQERLMRLREEIESLTAQRKALGELAALSTIELTLQGETKGMVEVNDKGWVQEAWNTATSVLGVAFRGIASIGIFLLVLAPIWIPIAFLIVRSTRKAIASR